VALVGLLDRPVHFAIDHFSNGTPSFLPSISAVICQELQLTFEQLPSDSRLWWFSPRCMQCRRGLAMRKLFVRPSVRLSVCLSNAWIVTKRKKDLSRCFTTHERSSSLVFSEEEWLVEGDPFYLKFWVNRPPLERNRRFSTDIRS